LPRCRRECLLDWGDEIVERGGQQTDRGVDADRHGYLQCQRRAKAGHRHRTSNQHSRPTAGLALIQSIGVHDNGWGTGFIVRHSAIGEVAPAWFSIGDAEIVG
jgi:hypothetical protein